MKKSFVAIASATALTLLLAGCGGGSSEPKASEELTKDTAAELQMAIWDKSQLPSVNDMIAGFNKEYPNVKITVSVTGYRDYWTKMRTAAEGKNLPDIFWMNGPNFQLYAGNGQLSDLSELQAEGKVDLANYPEGLGELYTLDNKLYGVPKDFDTIAVWYRKDLFEKAGLGAPDPNWTWEDYMKTCATLKEKLGDDVWPVVSPIAGDGQQTYYDTIAQAGGYVIKDGKSGFDNPDSIRGLQFWADLVKNGYFPPTKFQTDPNSRTLFENGKAAMYWSGSWDAAVFKENNVDVNNFDVAPLPQDKKKGSVIHGLSWVVAKNSAHQAAAKAFVAYAGTKEAQSVEAKNGTAIPAFKGTAADWTKMEPAWNLQVFLDAAENYSVSYPVSKNSSAWNAKEEEILVPAFDSGADMTEPAKKLAAEMNALLEKE